MGVVFCVTNTLNGRQFVAKASKSMYGAWRDLVEKAEQPFDDQHFALPSIVRMIRVYGADSFEIHELEKVVPPHSLIKQHKEWIAYLQTDKLGYNGFTLPPEDLEAEIRYMQLQQQKEPS